MPLKLTDLQKDRRTITFAIPIGTNETTGEEVTEELTVTYRPSAYTGKTEKELNELLKGEWKSAMGLEFVHRLVVRWDLEGEDDQPYPTSIDALSELPSTFIGEVITSVANDMGKVRQP